MGNNWDETIERVSFDEYVREKAAPEIKQLLTEYGPISIFWWDTPRDMSKQAFDSLHSSTDLQPGIITNDRCWRDLSYLDPVRHMDSVRLLRGERRRQSNQRQQNVSAHRLCHTFLSAENRDLLSNNSSHRFLYSNGDIESTNSTSSSLTTTGFGQVLLL